MRQWTIDAFTDAPFKGNPACVVEPLPSWPSDARMQALAAENNQAETAFLMAGDQPGRFGLRWFTPKTEVPLCGHATLASAHALYHELGLRLPELSFETLSGVLGVRPGERGYVMDFPADPPRAIRTPEGLAEALGACPSEVWAGQYLVALLSEAEVRGLTPDLGRLEAVSSAATRGRGNVGVSAVCGPGAVADVVSRFFAPGSGIAEDPTTGSLHCILAPLFASKLGRARLRFHQAYPGRGGDLVCELDGDRVRIEGEAVTVLSAQLQVDL